MSNSRITTIEVTLQFSTVNSAHFVTLNPLLYSQTFTLCNVIGDYVYMDRSLENWTVLTEIFPFPTGANGFSDWNKRVRIINVTLYATTNDANLKLILLRGTCSGTHKKKVLTPDHDSTLRQCTIRTYNNGTIKHNITVWTLNILYYYVIILLLFKF